MMNNKIYRIGFVLVVASVPFLANAAYLTRTSGIAGSARGIVEQTLIPLAFLLCLLYFFYGVAKYVWSEGTGKAEGKQIMLWGVVALFVVSSIWGIVVFIRTELDIDNKSALPIPTIGSGTSGGGSGSGSGFSP